MWRIRATTQALEFNLRMTRKPSTWVFVESQRKKSDAAFQWLKNYGVRYVFVPMRAESEGILLKNPLWNIGASNCPESRLCFVDSDVVMCNSDWVEKAATAFGQYDVLSLASHQYYQADESCSLHRTIGHTWVESGNLSGHLGFTLGLTRKAWQEIGGLGPALVLDDVHTYHKIVGDRLFKDAYKDWLGMFELPERHRNGHNLELGYAPNVACHVWHGDHPSKYADLTRLVKAASVKSESDMFDCSERLPTWKMCSARGIALSRAVAMYNDHHRRNDLDEDAGVVDSGFDIVAEFRSEMRKQLGAPDSRHPLFICTVAKDGFGLRLQDFIEFHSKVEEKFFLPSGVQPIVLFFTDCQKHGFKECGLNTVPLKNFKPGEEFAQCIRKELKYPPGTTIYYVPFGFDLDGLSTDIWRPDGVFENPDGTVLASVCWMPGLPKKEVISVHSVVNS